MRSSRFSFRKSFLAVCGGVSLSWWVLHRDRVFIVIGRLVTRLTLAFALVSSASFIVVALKAEDYAISKRYLPVPDGYCRIPELSSYLLFSYINLRLEPDEDDWEILEFFVDCEARNNRRFSGDFGIYFAQGFPEDSTGSESTEALDEIRIRARQTQRLSPAEALSKIRSAEESAQYHARLGLLREEDDAFYVGWLEREESDSGEIRIVASVAAYVATRGRIMFLYMSRLYEDETTIDVLLNTESILVRRLLTPEWI